MAGVYIFSEKTDVAVELVGFAKQLGKKAVLLSIGDADDLKDCGADKVIQLTGASERPENYAKAIATLLSEREAEIFMVASTCCGRELAAAVATYRHCGMASDVSSLEFISERVNVSRTMYGGAVVQHESFEGFCVVTVSAGVFEATGQRETAVVETLPVQTDARVRRVSVESIPKGNVDLTKAKKIIAVGLGMDKKEDLQMAEDLADVLDAEIGCTRDVAENRKWLPKSQYIGITGAIVSPVLYVSMGVSGQMQHVYGIRDSKVIVAVDKNKNAPIFRAADYGIVGDMYEIIPKLTQALKHTS